MKNRFGDILEEPASNSRWSTIKDRLAIVAVILVLAILLFLVMDGSFTNFRCTFAEFVTLECNRWGGEEHPSLQRYNEEPTGGSK
ncbi:hypothetical protein D3C83_95770 [compost metagenome]